MSTYIKIDTLQSGQPRPYADHEYVKIVSFTRDDGRIPSWLEKNGLPPIVPYWVDKEKAFPIARLFCPYLEPGDPSYNWASPKLVSFEMLDPTPPTDSTLAVSKDRSDRWKIHVRSAFTD